MHERPKLWINSSITSMIRGQQRFTEHFSDFQDCYVVIGGLAVDVHMEEQGIPFRATKDFDIILLVEALKPAFFDRFWAFIKDGGYRRKEISSGQRQYYRFIKPLKEDYPYQIELFSRRPNAIPPIEGHNLTPIPADEDISSLSAILMDEDYYALTQANTKIIDGLRIATEPLLIAFKIKAFLDLSQKKAEGQQVDSRDIKKHRNDVFRLAVTLTGQEQLIVPEPVMKDLQEFFKVIKNNPPEINQLLKNMGIATSIALEDIVAALQSIFNLN